ncbi:MAG: DUF362 domain-containing protein [Muribaculaceae bacterium]|nr:DUF362 domain-containing protein [Muribaculaceae bacterium]
MFALSAILLAGAMASCNGSKANAAEEEAVEIADSIPTVYYIKDITPENLVKVYEALARKAEGRVGIKISTGESNKSNHLDTALIADLVKLVNGTFIECNTAYAGNRNETEKHYQTAKEHGFVDLAGVDIMDAEGDTILAVGIPDGHLKDKNYVGKHINNYDFVVVLSHFKGHQMAGFGGALKNISIGIGSSAGKCWIHTAGKTSDPAEIWGNIAEQKDFCESMAEAAKAVADHFGKNILYINVANRLSVDCDCNGNPAEPKMADFGVLASLDPVALDQACLDMVFNSEDPGKADLIERINSRMGTHTVDHAAAIGVGSKEYKLVTITE